MDERKKGFAYYFFRFIRWVASLFYPKFKLEGLENLPAEPCVVVGNHSQVHGPATCELYFPGKHRTWCAGEMMELREVPDYAYNDFWSGKPRYIRWLFRLISYIIAPLAVCVFNSADTIGVYRDKRIVKTFRESVNALENDTYIVVFPECAEEHNNIVYRFQEGFVDVARMYYKKTGRELRFVPLYVAPALRTMYFGEALSFDAKAPIAQERERVCNELMDRITAMATALPRHRVVPYLNLPKSEYPENLPGLVKSNNKPDNNNKEQA